MPSEQEQEIYCFTCHRKFIITDDNYENDEFQHVDDDNKYFICERCSDYYFECVDYDYCCSCNEIINSNCGYCERCLNYMTEEKEVVPELLPESKSSQEPCSICHRPYNAEFFTGTDEICERCFEYGIESDFNIETTPELLAMFS